MASHIRSGDEVIITAGAGKGRTGEVMRVDPKTQRVWIKGLNLRARHMRPTRENQQGGVIRKEAAIHMSNVSPVVDGKPTRVRFETRDDGSKVRIAVRTGKVLGTLRSARK